MPTCLRCLALSLTLCCVLAGQNRPPNGDFENGQPGQPPPSWGYNLSAANAGMKAALVNEGCIQGRQCVMLSGSESTPAGVYGVLLMGLAPGAYRPQFRYRAAVRVEGAGTRAQMWARVDRQAGGYSAFDNMSDRPIFSGEWAYYTITLPVAADSSSVYIGVMNYGSGKVWVDDITLETVGTSRSEPPEGPRALTAAAVDNLMVFGRLAGYVRYFHPSDQSERLDWETFVIEGVRKVEDADSAEELTVRLQTLFDPVAPTVRLAAPGTAPRPAPDLIPESTAGLSVFRWAHAGLGLGTEPGIYRSGRVRANLSGDRMPDGFIDPASPYEADLGRGVQALIPLTLYADAKGTLPFRASMASTDIWTRSAIDRGTRLAGVTLLWNVLQHFYPYFDVTEVNVWTEFRRALEKAALDETAADFALTLRRMVAAYKDGHGSVSYSGPAIYSAPLTWAWAEGHLIVTTLADEQQQGVRRGDRVLTIDGKPVEQALATESEFVSGATPGWIRWVATQYMSRCNASTRRMKLEIEPYGSGGNRTAEFTCRAGGLSWAETRPDKVAELERGIMYVDIDRITAADWSAALPKLEAATGIVFDLRGYPRIWPPTFIQHLTEQTVESERFLVPAPARPDQVGIAWQKSLWNLPPLKPYLKARRVFLIDARAISQAETDLDLVEFYRLADLVGETTAGTTGNINPFSLPGGFRVVYTGMMVLKQDESRFHGVGIRPTIPVSRTRAAIADGVDEILARGVAAVKGR